MRSPNNDQKKKRITVTASCQCIKKAEMALIRLGFESKSNFAKHHLSRTTVTKFFQGQPISIDSLKRICKELELNWEDCLPREEIINNNQEEKTILPITNYQLPITNYQLPITNYQLPITNYQLPITNYQLPITVFPSLMKYKIICVCQRPSAFNYYCLYFTKIGIDIPISDSNYVIIYYLLQLPIPSY
jgi:DNA-binding Xre family transcriptional regulator